MSVEVVTPVTMPPCSPGHLHDRFVTRTKLARSIGAKRARMALRFGLPQEGAMWEVSVVEGDWANERGVFVLAYTPTDEWAPAAIFSQDGTWDTRDIHISRLQGRMTRIVTASTPQEAWRLCD